MLRKFVITGGPSTGKTSVIDELKKEFKVFEEVARSFLENKPFEERFSFQTQYEIYTRQIRDSKEADKFNEIVFFDRGAPEALAYFKIRNLNIPEDIFEGVKKENTAYEIVFFFDFVPYTNDEIRKESKEDSEKVHKLIREAYETLGYKIIDVPLMSIQERVDFIKSFLKSN